MIRIIAGPCQHETLEQSLEIAKHCAKICKKNKVKLEIEKRQKAEESRRRAEVIKVQRQKEKQEKEEKFKESTRCVWSKRLGEHRKRRL